MKQQDRIKLLFGPYHTPKCKLGELLCCELRGDVPVVGISDAPIPWPYTKQSGGGGHRILIVCEDLVRAIRQESSQAIFYWWGISESTVWNWRKELGVERMNKGSQDLRTRWAQETGEARKGESPSLKARHRMSEAQKRRVRRPRGSSFGEEFIALLGTMTDQEVADRTGLDVAAVRSRRHVLKIAPFIKKKPQQKRAEWTPEKIALLGTMPDRTLAKLLGITWMGVFYQRRKLKIPPFGGRKDRFDLKNGKGVNVSSILNRTW